MYKLIWNVFLVPFLAPHPYSDSLVKNVLKSHGNRDKSSMAVQSAHPAAVRGLIARLVIEIFRCFEPVTCFLK